jgi:AcrR family transcriptional regulator
MGRPREFDTQQAVDAAMVAFWASGYATTSTDDLCQATGLSRSSIYNTFGNKHELFTRSLLRYIETVSPAQIELLESDRPAREKIHMLLTRAIDDEYSLDPKGCLVTNTIIELGSRDEKVREVLLAGTRGLVAAIKAAIEAGQRAGEISREKDALALAEFVQSIIGALRLTARNGQDRSVAGNILSVALSTL